jgi:hypothetical protein
MVQLLRSIFAVALFAVLCAPLCYSQPTKAATTDKPARVVSPQHKHGAGDLVEEFSFSIKDFKVDHQSELNTLNISISYRYVVNVPNADYPDFRLLAKDVETLLTNYPNEVDYWEIVNKNLTSLLMNKYPAISRLTSEITADPTRLDPYVRSSRVTRDRPGAKAMRKRG